MTPIKDNVRTRDCFLSFSLRFPGESVCVRLFDRKLVNCDTNIEKCMNVLEHSKNERMKCTNAREEVKFFR